MTTRSDLIAPVPLNSSKTHEAAHFAHAAARVIESFGPNDARSGDGLLDLIPGIARSGPLRGTGRADAAPHLRQLACAEHRPHGHALPRRQAHWTAPGPRSLQRSRAGANSGQEPQVIFTCGLARRYEAQGREDFLTAKAPSGFGTCGERVAKGPPPSSCCATLRDYCGKGLNLTGEDAYAFSHWRAYLDEAAPRTGWAAAREASAETLHLDTSGHASPAALSVFALAMRPRTLVTVHGTIETLAASARFLRREHRDAHTLWAAIQMARHNIHYRTVKAGVGVTGRSQSRRQTAGMSHN